jgi:hypothetical protein
LLLELIALFDHLLSGRTQRFVVTTNRIIVALKLFLELHKFLHLSGEKIDIHDERDYSIAAIFEKRRAERNDKEVSLSAQAWR